MSSSESRRQEVTKQMSFAAELECSISVQRRLKMLGRRRLRGLYEEQTVRETKWDADAFETQLYPCMAPPLEIYRPKRTARLSLQANEPDVVFLHLSQQEADKERSLRSLLIQFWVEMCWKPKFCSDWVFKKPNRSKIWHPFRRFSDKNYVQSAIQIKSE